MLAIYLMLMLWGDPNQELIGAWELKKEDGRELSRQEMLYIYKGGKMMLDGILSHRGEYAIEGDQMKITFNLGGEKQEQARAFKLEGKKLSLGVEKGFAYYEKKDKPLPEWKKDSWEKLKEGHFELTAPTDWHIRKEPAKNGAQTLSVIDPNGNNALTLQRIPGREGQEVNLVNALKGVMGSMLEGMGIQRTVIHQREDVFYGRVGYQLETTKKFDDTNIVHVYTFGQKLQTNNYLVAMFSFQEGEGESLKKIMDSVTTADDGDLKTLAEAFEKKKAAEKPKDDHGHSHHGHKH